MLAAAPFALAALVINVYPYDLDSDTEILVALHLPVVLWFAIAFPYMGGRSDRASGAWTSSASRANGSSTAC
jgi:hypothetical protein